MISLNVLKNPLIEGKNIHKGAMILSDVDVVVERFSKIKKYFYLIERRGWRGINLSKYADIKLVEDSSVLKETEKIFPNAILLDIAGADFVDTEKFKPLNVSKEYEGIQIAAWQEFKRSELFFNVAKIMKDKKFVKFGHLFYNGNNQDELDYKEKLILYSRENCPNVYLPYKSLTSNDGLPNHSEQINEWINKSRMGILTSKVEGINRFKLECLSANIPVLVPEDACAPLKKHINKETGVFYEPTPLGLKNAINYVEDNYNSFSPRSYVLKNTGMKISIQKLKNALKLLAEKDGSKDVYEDILFDGRNQSFVWEEKALKLIENLLDGIENEINNG